MALEGNLSDMSLSDLLQVFRGAHKTGRLVLKCQPQVAMISFRDGLCIDATIKERGAGEPTARGEEAIFELFQWPDAVFTFIAPGASDQEHVTIARSTDWLILEGLRRREQHAVHSYPGVTIQSKIELVPNLSSDDGQISLNLDEWRVLSFMGEVMPVGQLVSKTGYSTEQTFGIVARLLALGVVRLQPQPLPAEPQRRAVSQAEPPRAGLLGLVRSIKTRLSRITGNGQVA